MNASNNLLVNRFRSLESKARIIGLYFCAGWCPDCVDATPGLENVIIRANAKDNDDKFHDLIEVFYISSDKTGDDMKQFKPSIFSEVPFQNCDDRFALKKMFGICAMKEMAELGMTAANGERKHGIPTLVLIDNNTGNVVTESGLDAINKYAPTETDKVLGEWKMLL